jgi:hypothetical protein
MHPQWLRRMLSGGRLAGTLVNGRWRIPMASIRAYETERARRHAAAAEGQDWTWEGNVVAALRVHFEREDWKVRALVPASKQHGVDMELERHGVHRLIEVKGYPSAKHTSGAKAGQAKAWRPTMARNYMGDLVMHALLLLGSHPTHEVAIAVPDVETFTTLLDRLDGPLRRLGIGAFVVHQDGSVVESLPPRRPVDLTG